MIENPLVSIITPSYNQGKYIEDTIKSVMNQDYQNIEHFVIDGGSIDNTIDILKKYENKYNLNWISEHDNGQSDALNKGFAMANGDIIGWVNSDDCYLDYNTFSYVVNKFYENQDVDVIYGDEVIIDEFGNIKKICKTSNWSYKHLLRECFICQPAVFFRKKIIKDNKIRDIYLCMDYEFWLRIGQKYNFLKVNKILAADRLYKGTKRESNKLNHMMKSKDLRIEYGGTFGVYYYMMHFHDLSLALFKNIKGVGDILKLKHKNNYAFNIEFPSNYNLIINQTSLNDVFKKIDIEFKFIYQYIK
ncbi:glycosyltransferase family 2 protein [Methanobacterium sp.]|uniref:glycosyltransferase family 2 protein n=1 Tax=Methanobacterium sp. TaxID=2164 RepID=UPI0031592122